MSNRALYTFYCSFIITIEDVSWGCLSSPNEKHLLLNLPESLENLGRGGIQNFVISPLAVETAESASEDAVQSFAVYQLEQVSKRYHSLCIRLQSSVNLFV